MRDRVYIVPTWIGLVYFTCAVAFFVWGAFGMHPLLGFLGFYLLIFFVFGALQTNDNLKNLTLDAGPGGVRIGNNGRESHFALRLVCRKGRVREVRFLARVERPLEFALPELTGQDVRVQLTTAFPIGLFHAWKPAHWRPTPFSAEGAGSLPGEVVDHREFRAGDREGDIDWKRSARRGKRIVKVREREAAALPPRARRSARWLVRGLLLQPFLGWALWASPLWLAQGLMLADLALLWFLFSHFFFPLDETGRLPAMLASLLRVFAISVAAFAALALLSPDFLAGLFPNPRQARVGFTRIAWMDPGQVARVRASNELVFRARLTPDERGVPYWRGFALEQTDTGLRWFGTIDEMPAATDAKKVSQRILLSDPDVGPVAVDHPVALPPNPIPRYYEAISEPGPSIPAPAPPIRYRQEPRTTSPEVRKLAQTWRATSPDLEAFVSQAREFFHRDFRYRLDPGTYLRDGLAEFLLHRHEGFCEHFAGAFATLLRLGSFPSRVVKGFKGGERNALDGTYRLRSKHAHVWVEAYSEKQHAWLRFDPTDWAAVKIGDDTPASRFASWFASLQRAWESLADRWEFAWQAHPPSSPWLWEWLARASVAAFLFMMIASAFARRRARRPRDPAFAFYDEHCRRMAARGVPRLPNEGPLAYGERCIRKLPELAPAIRAVTDRYLALCYHA